MYRKYVRNIIKVFLSSGLAQIISVIGTALLARLFLPEEFAEYGIYTALNAILLTFATARLDMALIQFDERTDWIDLICTSLYFLLIISVITFLILNFLPFEDLTPLLSLLVAGGVVISGLNKNYSNLLMSQQNYNALGVVRVIEASLFVIIAITVELAFDVDYILIFSTILSQLVAIIIAIYISNLKISLISLSKAFKTLERNREYVVLDSFSSMLNTLSRQLPALILPFILNLNSAGLYFFAHKLLAMPTALVSNSIGNVFRKTATLEYKNTGSLKRIYTFTLRWQSILACLGVVLFYTMITENHILYLFGDNWFGVYEVLRVLIIGFAVKFLVSPLTFIFYIVKRLEINLFGQSIFLLLTVVALTICYALDLSLIPTSIVLVISQVAVYAIYFFLTLWLLK